MTTNERDELRREGTPESLRAACFRAVATLLRMPGPRLIDSGPEAVFEIMYERITQDITLAMLEHPEAEEGLRSLLKRLEADRG